MSNEARLIVEINNKRPVELVDLARSMTAFGNEYRRFLVTHAPEADATDVRLYVKEIRAGSIITELVALAPYALPLLEHTVTIVEYAKKLKEAYDWLAGKADKKPDLVERETLQNLSQIVEPVVNDNGSQMNIQSVHIHGNVVLNMNSVEANAIQNRIGRELEALKEPTRGLHEQVVMYWEQARNQPDGATGDKAKIESLYRGGVKVRFANDQLKSQMLYEPEHPFSQAFVVDVQVETVNEKPVLYKVLHLHERISRST